jgi:hypothetical protein
MSLSKIVDYMFFFQFYGESTVTSTPNMFPTPRHIRVYQKVSSLIVILSVFVTINGKQYWKTKHCVKNTCAIDQAFCLKKAHRDYQLRVLSSWFV